MVYIALSPQGFALVLQIYTIQYLIVKMHVDYIIKSLKALWSVQNMTFSPFCCT